MRSFIAGLIAVLTFGMFGIGQADVILSCKGRVGVATNVPTKSFEKDCVATYTETDARPGTLSLTDDELFTGSITAYLMRIGLGNPLITLSADYLVGEVVGGSSDMDVDLVPGNYKLIVHAEGIGAFGATVSDREVEPSPSETPSETASPEPTDTASPEPTDTASPEPTETASPEPTDTASPEPTASEEPPIIPTLF